MVLFIHIIIIIIFFLLFSERATPVNTCALYALNTPNRNWIFFFFQNSERIVSQYRLKQNGVPKMANVKFNELKLSEFNCTEHTWSYD